LRWLRSVLESVVFMTLKDEIEKYTRTFESMPEIAREFALLALARMNPSVARAVRRHLKRRAKENAQLSQPIKTAPVVVVSSKPLK